MLMPNANPSLRTARIYSKLTPTLCSGLLIFADLISWTATVLGPRRRCLVAGQANVELSAMIQFHLNQLEAQIFFCSLLKTTLYFGSHNSTWISHI